MTSSRYRTAGGITIDRTVAEADPDAVAELTCHLDTHRGVLLASSYEYPGRYTRWDIGFADPPLQLTSAGREFRVAALNERGAVLLPAVAGAIQRCDAVNEVADDGARVSGRVREAAGRFPEEERSRQPSVFSVIRALVDLFRSDGDQYLGLYGAFGYDLAFQFEPLALSLPRPGDRRDLVLYIPDRILVVDHQRRRAELRSYDFAVGDVSTAGLPRQTPECVPAPAASPERAGDHRPGEYADVVRRARESFRRGDLFEVVPGQTFFEPSATLPSVLFDRLRRRNPAPYGFLINLGESEYLVGASPEMYVRVDGRRVETCPISGTIARGQDAMGDALQIQELLNSEKDESELTMCTDVDRNDKSRICEPGSVRVIGRRQIEMYSRLIHTVDHVEGRLRPEFDALDAFLSHTWAVTVTGAPKTWAMRFIEANEKSPRAWYGGAVGLIGFDGNMNTGLTLRTIRIKDGVAEVRAGATLLFDSDPGAEEAETRMKASALLDAIRRPDSALPDGQSGETPGAGRRVLLVDHEDSFVHTLANYLRQTGAEVVTWRAGFAPEELDALSPDLVVLSPGPGRPQDFDVSGTLDAAISRGIPVFGVCLGLQGMVEHFGGRLDILGYPRHGKASRVYTRGGNLFAGLPEEFGVGRYHSLYARPEDVPECLSVTAVADDGTIMAIEHRELPLAAVQFHPESILTLDGKVGLRLIGNVMATLARRSDSGR